MDNGVILREIRSLVDARGVDRLASPTSATEHRERREIDERLRNAKPAAARAFAELNGWSYLGPSKAFSLERLGKPLHASGSDVVQIRGRLFDHPLYFARKVAGERTRFCVAKIGQPYLIQDQGDIDRLREHFQVQTAPMPYASIHYPGTTLFIVVTEREVEVRWLPEQLSCSEFAEQAARKW